MPKPINKTTKNVPKQKARSRATIARLRPAGDWRAETLARVRVIIAEADPDAVEAVKWRKPSNGMRGVPVWSHNGIICTGETYNSVVKLTFARGASLEDPSGVFNAGLGGGTRRAIDIRDGDAINERALVALVRAAVALNTSGASRRSAPKRGRGARPAASAVGKAPRAGRRTRAAVR
jgi:hypothetical protein